MCLTLRSIAIKLVLVVIVIATVQCEERKSPYARQHEIKTTTNTLLFPRHHTITRIANVRYEPIEIDLSDFEIK